jgi:hypothetical protein
VDEQRQLQIIDYLREENRVHASNWAGVEWDSTTTSGVD